LQVLNLRQQVPSLCIPPHAAAAALRRRGGRGGPGISFELDVLAAPLATQQEALLMDLFLLFVEELTEVSESD